MPPVNPLPSHQLSVGELEDTSMVARTLTALTSFSERIVGRMRDRLVPSFTSSSSEQSQATSASQGVTDDRRSEAYLSYSVRAPILRVRRETAASPQQTPSEEPDHSLLVTEGITNATIDQYALNDSDGWDPGRPHGASSRQIGALQSQAGSLEAVDESAYSTTQFSSRAQATGALVESTRRSRLRYGDLEEGGMAHRQTEGRIQRLEERNAQLQLLLGIVGLGIMLIGGGTKLYEAIRSPTSTGP